MVDALRVISCGRRTEIRTNESTHVTRVAPIAQSRLSTKQTRRRAAKSIPTAKIAVYSSVFIVLAGVIALGYESPSATSQQPKQSAAVNSFVSTSDDSSAPSVDAIVANDVAASLTAQANLPIAATVANTSVSLAAQSELAQTEDTSIAKPRVVDTSSAERTVQSYTTKKGDTVPSVAAQFGISAQTLRWANDIVGDALEPKRTLKILPFNGVLYEFKSGDSVASIAEKYGSNETRITLINDLEIAAPKPGQQLIIPEGSLPETERPGYVAPAPASSQNQSFGGGSGAAMSVSINASAGNRYAPGNCTWYVYERRAQLGKPVGSYWGNANTWAYSARAAGLPVSNTPAPGAVLVDTAGYFGHVGVVEQVKPNGDIVITEMNNYAYGGFNIVNSRTISAGQASAYQYIH